MSAERALLPSNVTPRGYQLELRPDLDTFTFGGSVAIAVDVVEPTATVVLHANELLISSATAEAGGATHQAQVRRAPHAAPPPPLNFGQVSYSAKEETATLQFGCALPKGEATLTLKFAGILNDKMAGFYRSTYTDAAGAQKPMAVTQFEATDARRAFPCWDEPACKATFEVTMRVPAGLQALGNMPVARSAALPSGETDVTFQPTPVMSTYLLAFVIGEFEAVSGKTKHGVDVSVWTPLGLKAEGEFPLSVGIKTLEYFTEFFDQPYPLPKMDMIAIADFAAGAMENWGLVTYRSALLLYNEARTSLRDKVRIGYVVCHELAHQWFGNLVTMEWWTHLWLNEGFATWVGWLAVDNLFPKWKIWDRFVGEELERALELDALRSSHPIEVECKNSADVNEIFDAISYSKGASVIRMLADVIGIDAFQRGLRAYLEQHKYSNALSTDLWAALSASSGSDVAGLMGAWTGQTGFPVLSVKLDPATGALQCSQQRFFATGPDPSDATLWPVPLGVFGTGGESVAVPTMASFEVPGVALAAEGWAKLNKHMNGIFRVTYDEGLVARLAAAIPSLDTRDRYGLMSDAFSTAKAGYASTASALALARSYAAEENDTIVGLISGNLADLQAIFAAEPEPVQAQLAAFALKIFGPMAARVGWEAVEGESFQQKMLRPMLISRTGKLGDPAVLADSRARFGRYVAGDAAAIHPDLRTAVFSTVLKADGMPAFEQLIALYDAADAADQKVNVLRSLGASTDPAVHAAVLDFTLSSGRVRDQDVFCAIGALGYNPAAVAGLWAWFRDHFAELHRRFYSGSFMLGRIIASCCANFATAAAADEVEAFFAGCGLETDAVKRAIRQSVESIRANAAWLDGARAGVTEWLAANQ